MQQLFEQLLSENMSGFRKGHSCQSVLMHLVDMCKLNLENRGVSGVHLTDLSKALDCLSYKLVISKLQAYGFDINSCILVANYFSKGLKLEVHTVTGFT